MNESKIGDILLTDFQKKCLEEFRKQKDVLLLAPSSAGKSFITEQFILEYFESVYGKFLQSPRRIKIGFVLPYKSLAIQEFNHFLNLVEKRGIKVLLAVGGVAIKEEEIADANIIIGTYEKFLALQKRYEILRKYLRILVLDEFHFIGTDRGPVIEEIVLEWQKSSNKAQLILISSSISNPIEIADWLNLTPIIENSRPVPITYSIDVSKNVIDYILSLRKQHDQILVFSQSRSYAEALAERIASKRVLKRYSELDNIVRNTIDEIDEESVKKTIQEVYFPPLLNEVIEKGVCYHHAGLSEVVRLIIEEMYHRGEIDILVSTSTLSCGVNLPANVSVYTLKNKRIQTENNLVFQTLGRAGRLGYCTEGKGIVLVTNDRMRKKTESRFFTYKDDTPSPIFRAVKSKFGEYDIFMKYYLENMFYSDKPLSRELVHLIEPIEDSFWFYQNKSKLMRDLADFELLQALFSSSDSHLETYEVIDFYRRFDNVRGVRERKMEIQSINGINRAAVAANIKEQSKLYQIYLSPSRRTCSCLNKYSNFVCKHQRFLLEKYPETQERWLNTYGIIDFLTKEGFLVKSAGQILNLTYMGQIAAQHFVQPYDFLDYLEYCGTNKELTLTQYLQRFLTRDKTIKQEIKANELSSLQAIRLAQNIVDGREVRDLCERYNISDSFINDWRETIYRFLIMFQSINYFTGKVTEAEKISTWIENSEGLAEIRHSKMKTNELNKIAT